jgi:hypothetical protein
MRNYRKLNTAEIAGWVTAWATAIQTIAVSGALAVAFVEWRGHESQEQLKKRESATKLFFEQPEAVTKARHVAVTRSFCERATTSIEDPHMKAAIALTCSVLKTFDAGNSKESFYQQTVALRDYLTRVQLCVSTEICDEALSKKLFCTDVAILSAVDDKEPPNERVFPVSLLKECAGYKPPPE